MDWKSQVDQGRLPHHIAIIMDGNGRWAKQHNRPRVFGHRNGVKAVREATEAAAEIGVQYLTLYAFSTENWARPSREVNALMSLLVDTLHKETNTLLKNNIRLRVIGDISGLPARTRKALEQGIADTAHMDHMTLVLALNYSARWELVQATRELARQAATGVLDPEQIEADNVSDALSTAGIPDPELLIRTSGEQRLSNFLLWQCAYAELYFTETFWPDFGKEDLYQAIVNFQHRERRFGKISEQL